MTDKKFLSLDVKLSGADNYPEWTVSLKIVLQLVKVGDKRAWEIVTGDYEKPEALKGARVVVVEGEVSKGKTAEALIGDYQSWVDGNNFALGTIRKNCEDQVRARIGTMEYAKEAFEELKKAYEGKTATEFYTLLSGLTTSMTDGDRKGTIEEHINNYEQTWNRFVGIISKTDLKEDDGFGKGLKEFTKSEKAKAEFLLNSLPPFYTNTVENIRAKECNYDDAV